MPADRTWCPEGPREPTPEPTPEPTREPTPEPTLAPTPELPVKAPLSDNTYVYLYHIGGRWRVGPDYRNRDCWLFTKKTPNTPVSKATEWYRVDDDDNIVRSSFELDKLQESKSNVSRKFLLEHQKNPDFSGYLLCGGPRELQEIAKKCGRQPLRGIQASSIQG